MDYKSAKWKKKREHILRLDRYRDRVAERYGKIQEATTVHHIYSAKKYPEYEFKKHKGYPTKRHIELMNEYGVFDIYRFSYSPVKNCPKKREN